MRPILVALFKPLQLAKKVYKVRFEANQSWTCSKGVILFTVMRKVSVSLKAVEKTRR